MPHHLPGKNPFLTEVAEWYGLPAEATRGGAKTMYPEYRKVMPKPIKPAKKVGRAKQVARAKQADDAAADRSNKKAEVIALMKRAKGVTLAEIMEATKWQKHTIRASTLFEKRKQLPRTPSFRSLWIVGVAVPTVRPHRSTRVPKYMPGPMGQACDPASGLPASQRRCRRYPCESSR